MTIDQLTDVDPFGVRVSVYRNLRASGWSIKTAERVGRRSQGQGDRARRRLRSSRLRV
jgi:hypothetical protein